MQNMNAQMQNAQMQNEESILQMTVSMKLELSIESFYSTVKRRAANFWLEINVAFFYFKMKLT